MATGQSSRPAPSQRPAAAKDAVRNERGRPRLTPKHWLDAARDSLIRSGVNAIKIDQLARELRVTRGSFYWHFSDHADLLRKLLVSWIQDNTGPFLRVLEKDQGQPLVQILRYCEVWLNSDAFDPAYDAAVRDWARSSPEVEEVIRRADEERMDVLKGLFHELGYDAEEALVRARTLYFHQIGYFALKITQPRAERLRLLPIYFKVLTGCPMPRDRLAG
jgi:AcrR family transcriptional regulator